MQARPRCGPPRVALARDRLVLPCATAGAEARLASSQLGDLLDGVPEAIRPRAAGAASGARSRRRCWSATRRSRTPTCGPSPSPCSATPRQAAPPSARCSSPSTTSNGPRRAVGRCHSPSHCAGSVTSRCSRSWRGGLPASRERVRGRARRRACARAGAADPGCGTLELEPLRRLLESSLGVSWTRPVLVWIHATSGGNPLYALELARALARGDTAVPATLRGLLSERLSRLPPCAEELLAHSRRRATSRTSPLLAAAAGRDVSAGPRRRRRRRDRRLRGPHACGSPTPCWPPLRTRRRRSRAGGRSIGGWPRCCAEPEQRAMHPRAQPPRGPTAPRRGRSPPPLSARTPSQRPGADGRGPRAAPPSA